MGRRVFYAEPIQPGERGIVSVDFGPAMQLAGERIPSDNSVEVASITERESGKDFTSVFVAGSMGVSNNVATFQIDAPASDNYDYVARMRATTTIRPFGEEADVVIPVRSRPRRAFMP